MCRCLKYRDVAHAPIYIYFKDFYIPSFAPIIYFTFFLSGINRFSLPLYVMLTSNVLRVETHAFIHDVQGVLSTYHMTMLYVSNLGKSRNGHIMLSYSLEAAFKKNPGRRFKFANAKTEESSSK